jgi:peptide deformylase
MILPIVKFPNTILRSKMPEFDFSNPIVDPKELEKNLIETMFASGGIGLAANQAGIEARAFAMGDPRIPENATVFFNPIVTANTDDIADLEEGCLSFPGIYVNIKRPKAIKVSWQNSSGEQLEGEFDGYMCKVFLHELDHLEGVVFSDRVSQLKWAMALKKLKSNRRKFNA